MPSPPSIAPPVSVDRSVPTPLYRQVYCGYRDAIVEGRLRPGQRLPSTRSLAAELGISRIPVVTAFEQLLAEGYCESRIGAGTFVTRLLPDVVAQQRGAPAAASRTNSTAVPTAAPGRRTSALVGRLPRPEVWLRQPGPFALGGVSVDGFPFRSWGRLLGRLGRRCDPSLVRYGSPLGHPVFRESIAAYLHTARGVRCEADQVLVASGSQQAIEITARTLLDPGDTVWLEEPGYWGARHVLRSVGVRLVPVPVDEEGLDVEAGIARAPAARAVFVTPSHQFPLGVTMSAARRLRLLEWAASSGAWVIEDDYNSEFRYDSQPIAALQAIDRSSRVVYIGTFSKMLFPGLRVGYLVVPADLVPDFLAVRRVNDICPPPLLQAALAELLGEGHFARHLRRTRQLYRQRRSELVAALAAELGDTIRVHGAQAGMHLTVTFERRLDRTIAAAAAAEGIWTMPLSSLYVGEPSRQGLVLGYGGLTVAELQGAVRRLGRIVRRPEPGGIGPAVRVPSGH